MMNKRGIQLSINFIVILIIAMFVFSFGIKLAYDLVTQAEEIRADVDENTQRAIEQSLMGGSQVSIPINRQETKIADSVVFGLGIFNIGESRSFNVNMEFEKAYNSETVEEMDVDATSWIISEFGPYSINKNEQKILAIPVAVPRNIVGGTTPMGVYVFKVEVRSGGIQYGSTQKVYVEVI